MEFAFFKKFCCFFSQLFCPLFFHWLCFLMYPLHFFNRESMVVIRQSTASKDADWQTWVEILGQRFPNWVLWPLQKLRAASSFMGRDLRELSKMAAAEIFEVVRGTQASSPGTMDRWMGKTCSSVMRVSFTTCFIGQNYIEYRSYISYINIIIIHTSCFTLLEVSYIYIHIQIHIIYIKTFCNS